MALPNGIQSTQELLDAQAHVSNVAASFINSMSLKCMIELGIPNTIYKHGKPMTLSELTNALQVDQAKSLCIERLMRLMIHSKLFVKIKISEENNEEGYWLTPSSLLLTDYTLNLGPYVTSGLDPILMDPWHHVSKWFRTDDTTPFVTAHGKTLWEHAGQNTRLNAFFNEAMASDAQLVSSVLSKDCSHVFEGFGSVVDVGGGMGAVAKAIVDAFPGLKCTVLDLPHVVAGLEASKDVTYVGGDMFESIPPADVVFIKSVLHDWADEDCRRILKNCREAILSKEKKGKVIIVEMVVDDDRVGQEVTETQLFSDMQMVVLTAGRERTEKEWRNLFFSTGFTSYKITNSFGLRSLIEVFP